MGYGGIIGQQPDLSNTLTKDEATGLYLTKTEANKNYVTKSELLDIPKSRYKLYSETIANNKFTFWHQNETRPLPYQCVLYFKNVGWEQSGYSYINTTSGSLKLFSVNQPMSKFNGPILIKIGTNSIGYAYENTVYISGTDSSSGLQINPVIGEPEHVAATKEYLITFTIKITGSVDIYWYY